MVLTKSDCDIKYIIFKIKNQRVRPRPLLSPSLLLTPGSPSLGNTENYLCVDFCLRDRNSHPGRGWAGRGPGAGRSGPRVSRSLSRSGRLPSPRRAGLARGATSPRGLGARRSGSSKRRNTAQHRPWSPGALGAPMGAEGSARLARPGRPPVAARVGEDGRRSEEPSTGTPAPSGLVRAPAGPAPRRPNDEKQELLPGPTAASAPRPVGNGRQRSELSRPSQPPASERTPEPVPPLPGRARPPSRGGPRRGWRFRLAGPGGPAWPISARGLFCCHF